MKETTTKFMTITMAATMITGSLTACGSGDNKTKSTTAVETTAEASEFVEKTTAEATDAEETAEVADTEESTEIIDTKKSTETADAEKSTEAADVEESAEAFKEEAASKANTEVAGEIAEIVQN